MNQNQQDFSARRISPEYDCQLPRDVLHELLTQRRPSIHVLGTTQQAELPAHQAQSVLQLQQARIHIKPPEPPEDPPLVTVERSRWYPARGWLLVLSGVAAIVAALALSWPSPQTREKALQESAARSREVEQKAREALDALRSSKPSVQPTPVQPVSQPLVDQTRLVQKPAPKATLLRLPWQELGVYKWYELPDVWGGGAVWARYLGTVTRFSQIPPNPVPGDLWNVTETGNSWIYCFPHGYDHAIWIDP